MGRRARDVRQCSTMHVVAARPARTRPMHPDHLQARLPARGAGAEQRGPSARVLRLAILPFASGRDVPDHLGPAIAEEVTTRLTAFGPSWVCVLARDSVFTLAGRGMTAVQVGVTLKADLVLAGILFAMPTHYRLRTEMIRVEDGTQIWVEDILVARRQIPRARIGTRTAAGLSAGRRIHDRIERDRMAPIAGMPMTSFFAAITSGKPMNGIACRTACSTSSRPPNSIPR